LDKEGAEAFSALAMEVFRGMEPNVPQLESVLRLYREPPEHPLLGVAAQELLSMLKERSGGWPVPKRERTPGAIEP
jgi:hypothetical protein